VTDKLLPRILIIEQENTKNTNISLYNNIERAGFDIIKGDIASKAFALPSSYMPAVIIINISAKENPLETIAKIRKSYTLCKIPVIYLLSPEEPFPPSSKDNLISFIQKPFSLDELINAIRNLLRRSKVMLQDKIIRFKNVSIDLNTQKLYKNDITVRLGPTEFKILQLFLQFPTIVFSRQKIIECLWGCNAHFSPRIIDVHINRIREALSDDKEFIKTVRLVGYCLNFSNNDN
jgi:DNA-binding response OmpR family regulator